MCGIYSSYYTLLRPQTAGRVKMAVVLFNSGDARCCVRKQCITTEVTSLSCDVISAFITANDKSDVRLHGAADSGGIHTRHTERSNISTWQVHTSITFLFCLPWYKMAGRSQAVRQ